MNTVYPIYKLNPILQDWLPAELLDIFFFVSLQFLTNKFLHDALLMICIIAEGKK